LPQATDVRDPHDPDSNCILDPDPVPVILPAILLNVIVGFVFVATNLYHTSSSGLPVQLPMGTPALVVAPVKVPLELKQPVAVGIK
jgi:hypothetical protein